MKKFVYILLFGLLISCQSFKESKLPPNIILILTDDQGWGDLSFNGNLDLSTPNIDKLAKTGAFFEHFFVSPVCSPTRAEILTGRHHVRSGVYSTSRGGERLDIDEETIAEVFKATGYQTAAYGKWHNGMQAPFHPNSRGFDDFYGFCSGHWGNYFNPLLEHNGKLVKGRGFIIDDLTQHGINFIRENNNQPFFLYLPYNTPHSPMQVPDKFWRKFQDKKLSQIGSSGPPTNQNQIDHSRAALAMCENIDWNVGRIINELKKNDLLENTIIVYLSDNGPNGNRWNGEMKGIKGSTDEGGVRSPMIINWLGKIPEGKIINKIASGIDLLPTLKDLAGIMSQPKIELDGVSLKPLIMNEKPKWKERYIYNYWRGKLSLRSQKYRLDHKGQLFDMIEDPNQTTDISNQKSQVLNKLFQAKEKWLKTVRVELPEKDERPFYIGHPSLQSTQIPARDGNPIGEIIRSNRFPNDTYFTNWINLEDSITWEAEVLQDGDFEVVIYYTCAEDAVGSKFELSFGKSKLIGKINKYHDPEEFGKNRDRSPRIESYTKDFIPLNIGKIRLKKGVGTLKLKGIKKTGKQLMDFRLLMLKRV
ncbi:MAG: sulfatase-like hydrolase/transferase [Flavobacteriaceae bacterium]|jgi:arylsulfatase A-like enzyme|nr:sulfatase-like hydrolase/transferase [Flavobacteriaceae bacterium]